jgi:hypothetical protein
MPNLIGTWRHRGPSCSDDYLIADAESGDRGGWHGLCDRCRRPIIQPRRGGPWQHRWSEPYLMQAAANGVIQNQLELMLFDGDDPRGTRIVPRQVDESWEAREARTLAEEVVREECGRVTSVLVWRLGRDFHSDQGHRLTDYAWILRYDPAAERHLLWEQAEANKRASRRAAEVPWSWQHG